ncbi:chalcone--flavanone isomerase-like [Rhododendron vialii]|uniref:chalcone--flavanone isomerase-like n=1 Tax=Rhododendron vialii TaxID=182163 RepID=UPI00265DDCD5|nr:chalcone--flavanone isomerase-like [Rhododendron vialii]
MSNLLSVTEVQVESHVFPAMVKPPGTTKTLFLGGAGVRAGVYREGEFAKVTAIGVYLDDNAVECLAVKWKGKSAEELADSIDFFRDIVTGPFEKFIHVKMILHLTGMEYAEKVKENCLAYWKATGTYNDAAGEAIENFVKVFNGEDSPPGAAVLFTQFPCGSITISFSKDESIPETGKSVIENREVSETVLETIIGKNGVSPAAKQILATRLSELLNSCSKNPEK